MAVRLPSVCPSRTQSSRPGAPTTPCTTFSHPQLPASSYCMTTSNELGVTRTGACSRSHTASSRSSWVTRSAPKWNPQNVENPVVMPNPNFSPSESVKVQMEALANNDEPWPNHGIQTVYEYADEAGSMEMSWYFVTFKADIYHMDHFMGKFSTRLGPLLYNKGWQEVAQRPDCPEPGLVQVDVSVTDSRSADAGVYTYTLVQRQLGSKKGCWMTKSLGKKQH